MERNEAIHGRVKRKRSEGTLSADSSADDQSADELQSLNLNRPESVENRGLEIVKIVKRNTAKPAEHNLAKKFALSSSPK